MFSDAVAPAEIQWNRASQYWPSTLMHRSVINNYLSPKVFSSRRGKSHFRKEIRWFI